MFDHSVNHYTNSVSGIVRNTGRYLIIYLLIVVGMAVLFLRLPTSFLPEEDQGVFLTMIQLPLALRKNVRRMCWIKSLITT